MSLQNQVDILASSMKNCNQLIEQVNQTYKCNFKDKYENETYDDIKLNVYCGLCRNAGYNACIPNEQHHHGGCYNTGICQVCGGDGKIDYGGGGI